MIVMKNQNPMQTIFTSPLIVSSRLDNWSEKLPNIPKYNSDMDKLDAWE